MSNEIETELYTKCFSYDIIETIKNLLKLKKVTQEVLAKYLFISERGLRKYFNNDIMITQHFLIVVCVVSKLPALVSIELFRHASLPITISFKGYRYFNFIKDMENRSIEENIEIIYKEKL